MKKAYLLIFVLLVSNWLFSQYNCDSSQIINIKQHRTIRHFPSIYSKELKSFIKDSCCVLDYINGFLLLRDSNEIYGYIEQKYSGSYSNLSAFNTRKTNVDNSIDTLFNINVCGAFVEEINSASGVQFTIDWYYRNEIKDVKYIYFTVIPYNNVGDFISCDIAQHSKFTGKVTGPISSRKQLYSHTWENAWYNNTVSNIKIVKIKVIYEDNSQYIFVNELKKISSPFIKYSSY